MGEEPEKLYGNVRIHKIDDSTGTDQIEDDAIFEGECPFTDGAIEVPEGLLKDKEKYWICIDYSIIMKGDS